MRRGPEDETMGSSSFANSRPRRRLVRARPGHPVDRQPSGVRLVGAASMGLVDHRGDVLRQALQGAMRTSDWRARRMMRAGHGTRLGRVVTLLSTALVGCTSFGTVRSAEVVPGPSIMLQASASAPPGDEAAWFWSGDCASECNHSIVSADLGITFGHRPETGKAFSLGAGVSGILYPYVDGYVELGNRDHPYGLGARVGIPVTGWSEHQLYGRYDIKLDRGGRILVNPALFLHTGNSPNGENPGYFLGWVQGVGYLIQGEGVSLIPAVSLVVGGGRRQSYSEPSESFRAVFGTVSLSIVLHGNRD